MRLQTSDNEKLLACLLKLVLMLQALTVQLQAQHLLPSFLARLLPGLPGVQHAHQALLSLLQLPLQLALLRLQPLFSIRKDPFFSRPRSNLLLMRISELGYKVMLP